MACLILKDFYRLVIHWPFPRKAWRCCEQKSITSSVFGHWIGQTVRDVYLWFGKVSLLFTPLDGAVRVIWSQWTSDYLLIILLVLGNNTHQHTKWLTTEKAGKLQWLTQTASFSCFHRLSIVGTLCCLLGQQYWLLMTIMIISISPSYPELFSANYPQGNLIALSLGRYLSWSCLVKYR